MKLIPATPLVPTPVSPRLPRDEVRIEYMDGERGLRHRLVVNGSAQDHWTIYEHPSEHQGYMGFTQYWGQERIVKISEHPTKSLVVCPVCGEPTGWDGDTFAPDVCEHERKLWKDRISIWYKPDEVPPMPIREA